MDDLISRADAIEAVCRDCTIERKDKCKEEGYCYEVQNLKALPSADAEQVTSKLNKPCDSLLKSDSAECKEQKSKLEHDREWIIGCIKHDGFIKTDRFDKANQIILEALSADAVPTVIRAKAFMRKEDFDKWAEDIKRQNKSIVCIPYDAEVVSADAVQGWRIGKPTEQGKYMVTLDSFGYKHIDLFYYGKPIMPNRKVRGNCWYRSDDEWGDVVYDDTNILAWQPLPKPYKGGDDE